MNIKKLAEIVEVKSNFVNLNNYLDFTEKYLNYIARNLQAIIVSQNENHYKFYQYNKDGNFQITRPINSNLMYDINGFISAKNTFLKILKYPKDYAKSNKRNIINNAIYTIQSSIGATLDSLSAGKSNTARKINGDLFERLIRLIINEIGITCESGVIHIPIRIDGKTEFNMSFQHDLIMREEDVIKLIGSVKTSSKDRIDKIFIDKFIYDKLSERATPFVVIILNDVQRKNTKKENEYGINSTFFPGHFKAYTVKINPLDGVYYCDIRPNMLTENILKDYIKTFDYFICEDIWNFLN
jgi:hypothetical protein